MHARRFVEIDFEGRKLMTDNHRTEAACLLEQGAQYRRRIGLLPLVTTGDPIFAGFKQGAFSLYFGDAPIFHFDLEGRCQRAFVDNIHYLKGLDASIHAIDRGREGPNLVLKRRMLTDSEAADFDDMVRSTALELIAGLDAGTLGTIESASPKALPLRSEDLRTFLERISAWDSAAWFAHRGRYQRTYGPLPFLPPECQNAVVLQATLGHATGIGFAGSAANAAYTRSISEFMQHTHDVAALWGGRLLQSRHLFLAGSDVLHQSVETIADLLNAIGQAFPIEPRTRGSSFDRSEEEDNPRFDGVHAFLGDFTLARPDRDGWRNLNARGLVRISFGVESGDSQVRAIYHKNWAEAELRATVSDCKAAGIGVSVLTLVGAGGVERAEAHVERTVQLIESLALGAGDFVFLLDEKEIGGAESVDVGITSLRGDAWSQQQSKFKEGLAPLRTRRVKVLPYTMEKQWT
jgi:hypothetical protein